MFITQLFVSYAHVNLCHFFFFLLVSGVGCGFCLLLFLDFSIYRFENKFCTERVKARSAVPRTQISFYIEYLGAE